MNARKSLLTKNHNKHRKTEAKTQVDHKTNALLALSLSHGLHTGDPVETAGDGERSRWDGY